MAYTVLGITVDFSRLVAQRDSPHYHGTAHPWLACGYVVIQALAALLPGAVYPVTRIHEGLSRQLIGHDKTRRTGIWGGFNHGATLFVVPGPYTPEVYARSRIWMLRGCGWSACRQVLGDLWRQVQLSHHPIVAELMYRAIPYVVLFDKTGAREYVTTSIGQFPESPAVPVANAMGLKTILWTFGDQVVLPTKTGPQLWLVPAAMYPAMSEVHLWTDSVAHLWKTNLLASTGPTIIVDGVRMLGLKPVAFPPSSCIGIADTPAKKDAHKYGIFTPEWVDAFYRDIHTAAAVLFRAQFVVKSKYADSLVSVAPHKRFLRILTNVEELDADCNPWLLLEKCGLIICLPYSSMGVAALEVGREVIFYDPTGAANWYPNAELQKHRIVGKTALLTRLAEYQKLRSVASSTTLADKLCASS